MFKLFSLLLVDLAMSQYMSKYRYTTNWDNKRRLVVVQGDNMVEEVRNVVDGMNCQLATRNINIIYLSGDQPQDVAFYLNGVTEVKDLDDTDVQNVKSEVGRGSGDWAVLVGYDGGVKMVMGEREGVRWGEIFNRIDRMPMRRQEIRNGAVCP